MNNIADQQGIVPSVFDLGSQLVGESALLDVTFAVTPEGVWPLTFRTR